jgi:DNA invertase Pin-like site-specific DNA recombinase
VFQLRAACDHLLHVSRTYPYRAQSFRCYSDPKAEILDMLASGRRTAAEVARLFRVHRATISRVAAEARTAHPAADETRAISRTV